LFVYDLLIKKTGEMVMIANKKYQKPPRLGVEPDGFRACDAYHFPSGFFFFWVREV